MLEKSYMYLVEEKTSVAEMGKHCCANAYRLGSIPDWTRSGQTTLFYK